MALLLLKLRRLVTGRRAARARRAAGAIALAAIVCVGLGLASPPARAGESVDGTWTRLGPPGLGRLHESTFFDPIRRRLLSFERDDNTEALWSYEMGSGAGWSVTAGIPAGALDIYGASYVLDPVGQRILAVSPVDEDFTAPRPTLGVQVWSLDLMSPTRWDSVAVVGPRPAERNDAAVALDPVGRRLFLAGGASRRSGGGGYGDLWQLTLEGTPTWSVVPVVGPGLPGFADAKLHFDPQAQRLIVAGGSDSIYTPEFEGLRSFALDLAGDRTWRPIAVADTLYFIESDAPQVFDPTTGFVRVLRGAYNNGAPAESSYFWVLDPAGAGSWRREAFGGGERVIAGSGHELFHDASTDRILLVGGNGSFAARWAEQIAPRADVWTVETGPGGTWQREFSSIRGGVSYRYPPLVHDPIRRRVWGISGSSGSGGTTYGYPLERSGVLAGFRGTAPAPASRSSFAAVFDPEGNRAVVFGGAYSEIELGDLWEISYSFQPARWRRLLPAGPFPNPRFGASAVFDPQRRRMIMFGGYAGRPLDELWELDLSRPDPGWRRLETPGAVPSARFWHTAVYDSRRDGMIVHGGATGTTMNTGALRDTWMLSFADGDLWVPITPNGSADSYRYGHAAVYDPVGDRMIAFHGRDVAGARLDMTALELAAGPRWVPFLPAGGGPAANYLGQAFYDAPEDRVVLFTAGRLLEFPRIEQSWEIRFARDTTEPPPLGEGPPLRLLAVGPNPSRGEVFVSFQIPRPTDVRLRLFDVRGRAVRDLGSRTFQPGPHILRWDGHGDDGTRLRDGVYFARLEVEGQVVTGKLILMD